MDARRRDARNRDAGDRAERGILAFSRDASQDLDLQAIVVDVCGAVYDDSPWRRWLFHLLLKMGLHTNYVAFYRLWEQEHAPRVKFGEREFSETLQQFLLSAGLTVAQASEVEVAVRARKQHFDGTLRPMPGVESTLRKLRAAGFRIAGLVSACGVAGDRLQQHRIAGEFDRLFDGRSLRRDVGDEAHYRKALVAWAACPPERIGLVSQDEWELQRAAAAGVQTIAVNFEGAVRADLHFEHFGEAEQRLHFPRASRLAG